MPSSEPNALELLHPIAILLHRALEQYLAAQQLRLNHQLVASEVSEQFVTRHQRLAKQIAEIVEDLLSAKRTDGLSDRYIETIRNHLRRFAAAFPRDIGSIAVSEIEHWLRSQNVGARARNNMRSSIVTLFNFARKQGYLPKGQPTEADDVAKAKAIGGKIGILKASDLAPVVARAPAKISLFLVLGAFTGMRSSEILRLEWRDVNFERQFITVAPEKAKTATRRLVPILPNLMQWLEPYRTAKGSIFRTRRDAARAIAFAKSSGLNWPNNALRHSYATYRLAATADAARVALEMGNSPQKLISNYRELADVQEAEAWFAISARQCDGTTKIVE